MSDIEKIHGITPDLTRENVDRLLALFPDVATEITDPKTGKQRKLSTVMVTHEALARWVAESGGRT